MELKNIIENILNNEKNAITVGYLCETVIMNLLKEYANNQSKDFCINFKGENGRIYDAFLPNGIDELDGETVVEFKVHGQSFIRGGRGLIDSLSSGLKVKNILLICADKMLYGHKERILAITAHNNVKVIIWDIDELTERLKDISVSEFYPLNNICSLHINNIVKDVLSKKDNEEWKEERKRRIKKLKEIYLKDDLVLFLGAGVSQDAGLPDWESLISDLIVKMIDDKMGTMINDEERKSILKNMKEFNDYSPILQASWIKSGFNKDEFNEKVAESLYRKKDSERLKTSKLLKSLAQLCIPRRSGIGIKGVVTYNFDDLLEHNLKERNILYRSINNEMYDLSVEELPIYHVHGLIPEDMKSNKTLSSSLVFTEDDYYNLYNNPYSWPNIVQVNYLRENTCLMVGLSMTDSNLRRLLSIATEKLEEPKHFAIMKRNSFSNDNIEVNIRQDKIDSFKGVYQELQERFFEEKGISVIWIDDFDEIPGILDSIRDISSENIINHSS